MVQEIVIKNLEELQKAVKVILRSQTGKVVFTLTGDLGAGKTTLTQAV